MTHRDYLEEIGNTAATATTWREKRWNHYYFMACRYVVARMLSESGVVFGTVLDIGTSHGNWLQFLRSQGFRSVQGVELHPGRAALARRAGYEIVHNCDAASIPLADSSVDVAVSNDVLVHVLRLEDKVAVLREAERVLRVGGALIFNHTMSRAFGLQGYQVVGHCSYLDLHELLELVQTGTSLRLLDIKPSYYSFADRKLPRSTELVRNALLLLPFGPFLRFLRDYAHARRLGLQHADSVYLRLAK